jgi:prepilin-type N-terminal cleavage/methylation domain-containing protein
MTTQPFIYRIRGFTIVEVLIVITIIGILSALSIVAYNGVQSGARDKSVISDVTNVVSEVSRYGVNNGGTYGNAVAWYSGGSANANIKFTPSSGNVIDVVANTGLYCVRAYNAASATHKTLATAYSLGTNDDACTVLSASVAAGGSGDASLTGWWKFNGDAMDSSGNGKNGSLTSVTSASGQSGATGGAYDFNGSSSTVTIGDKVVSYPMTISVWYKSNNSNYRGHIFYTRESGSGDGWGSEIETHLSQENTSYGFYVKSGTCTSTYSFGTVDLAWHHIVFVLNDTYRAYVDGSLSASAPISCLPNFSATLNELRVGRPAAATRYLNGSLDDLRVYNRELTLSEIQSIYAANAK